MNPRPWSLASSLLAALAFVVTGAPAASGAAVEAKTDRSWISLTGDVVDSSLERFRLDYGEGLVTVEMDDWDWYDESGRIRAGDCVTVYGRIDDDLFEKRTIEADRTRRASSTTPTPSFRTAPG